MKTMPDRCVNINTVRSFCDCIAGDTTVDVAAKGFCERVNSGDTNVTEDDLVELKKALRDLES